MLSNSYRRWPLLTIFLALPSLSIASESPCAKDVKIHKEKNLANLESKVQTALKKPDQDELKKLVACDFMIAKHESDAGGFRRGINVIPNVIKIFKGIKFKSQHNDYGSQVNLDSNNEGGPGLVFRKDDASGWYWAGIGLRDSMELDKLLKNSYRLGDSDDSED